MFFEVEPMYNSNKPAETIAGSRWTIDETWTIVPKYECVPSRFGEMHWCTAKNIKTELTELIT